MSERDLFIASLQITDPTERSVWLDRECGDDAALRQRIEVLLQAFHQAGSLLENPVVSPEASVGPTGQDDCGSDTSAEASGGLIAGRYKLLEEIGDGGMGTVWMAQQTEPVKRLVAVKLIKRGMDSKAVLASFEVERQALALMDHPNIAKVHDAGTTGTGRPFFVMELVKGVPITRYCDQHRLSPRQRLELFVPVCQAIQHAHQKGIIHRDIKPSNVLVALYDDRPVPKVIDFGLAKATGKQLTEQTLHTGFGAVVGTVEYMSPEQASFNQLDVDTRSDIYSLGVLLYELLAGSPPFTRMELEKAGMLEMLRVIREQQPSKPSTKLSTADGLPTLAANRGTEPKRLTALLRGELDWIVMKALEKDRSRRYETANGLAVDLQRYLADEPVQACPPSAGYRLRKFVRRNKGPVLATSMVMLALVGGIVGTTWGLLRAIKAEADARMEAAAKEEARTQAVQSEARAKDDRDKAVAAEADTRAFSDFLVDHVLATPRPEGVQEGLGVNVTMVHALEAAEAKLDEAFAGRPRAEATARQALGVTWKDLGRYVRAERHLRRAVELHERELGPDAFSTLNSRNSLGLTLCRAGRSREALPILEDTLRRCEAVLGLHDLLTLSTLNNLAIAYGEAGRLDRTVLLNEQNLERRKIAFGPNHAGTLTAQNNLATALRNAGQPDRAVLLQEEVVGKAKSSLGPDHPYTLLALTNLAAAYRAVGRPDRAVTLLEQTLENKRAKFGPDHPDTLTAQSVLASAYRGAGQPDKALPLYEQTLRQRKAQLGPDHPQTFNSMNNLAVAYRGAGRLAQALPVFEETLKLTRARQGADHPDTLNSMYNLAVALADAGRATEAMPLYEEALSLQRVNLGAEHPETLKTLNSLAKAYSETAKQPAKAEPLYRERLALERRQLPADSPVLAGTLATLGLNLSQQQKYAEAEPVLRECLQIREQKQPDEWTTFNSKSLVGGSLMGQKNYSEAEPHLLKGYEGMKQREAKMPANARIRLTEALDRLVQLYDAWDKKDQADDWRKKLEAHKRDLAIKSQQPEKKQVPR